MRPRSLAVVGVRIFALVIGVEVVTSMVSLIAFSAQLGGPGGTGPLWVTLVARLVIAFALWRFAEDFARPMARGTDDEPPVVARRTANVAAVAFSVIGVILISEAVTDFVATLASTTPFGSEIALRFRYRGPALPTGRGAAILVQAVQAAIGMGLIVASGNLARYLSRKYPESEPPVASSPGNTPPAG